MDEIKDSSVQYWFKIAVSIYEIDQEAIRNSFVHLEFIGYEGSVKKYCLLKKQCLLNRIR